MNKLLLAGLIALLAAWAAHGRAPRLVTNKILCTPDCAWTRAACLCPPRNQDI